MRDGEALLLTYEMGSEFVNRRDAYHFLSESADFEQKKRGAGVIPAPLLDTAFDRPGREEDYRQSSTEP